MITAPSAKVRPSLAPAAAPGSARPGRRPRGGWVWAGWVWAGWVWAAGATALAVGAMVVLATVGDGTLLERLLSPLEFLQRPYLDLAAASQGEDAATGAEYVAFLAEGHEAASLDGFFRAHPAVRFVSPGLLPGVAVVRIRGDVAAGVQALREQPPVKLVLKSRLGMVCH